LLAGIWRFAPQVVSTSIGCISTIIRNVTKTPTTLISVAQQCYNVVLKAARDQNGRSPTADKVCAQFCWCFLPLCVENVWRVAQIGNITRCLMIHGAICDHFNMYKHLIKLPESQTGVPPTDEQIAERSILQVSTFPPTAVAGPLYIAALYALQSEAPALQGRCAAAFCSAFTACPKLIFKAQDTKLLDKLFDKHGFSEVVHERWLQSLAAVMMKEEVPPILQLCWSLL
jgi:hypothetical protein